MITQGGRSVGCAECVGYGGGSRLAAPRSRLAQFPTPQRLYSPRLRRDGPFRALSARADSHTSIHRRDVGAMGTSGTNSGSALTTLERVPGTSCSTDLNSTTGAGVAALSTLAVLMLASLAAPQSASAAVSDLSVSIPGLVGDSPFREGFVSGFLLIFFSEIGDKTFFIALLLALQRPKGVVFAGTFGALAIMTVISVGLGRVLHEIDELFPDVGFPLDDALAVALLVFFGIQTLASASDADETAEEEKGEAQEVVDDFAKKEYEVLGLVASTFALVFAAEWGDKSFLATIALAAASDPLGVIGGAVTGHGVATVIAVLGGSFLGRYLSERTVQYVGGSLFLVFAAATLVDIFRGV